VTPYPPVLIAGPYEMPACRVGQELDSMDTGVAIVDGITDALIPWPYCRSRNGRRRLFVTGRLIDAVQAESVAPIMAWWGVGRTTVQQWRRLMGVTQFNLGTLAVWYAREVGR
jgi:hypothetical protein